MSETHSWIDEDRLFLRTWEVDSPTAEVILAHGYAEHSGRYLHVAQRLSEAGFNVSAPDHGGHGQSRGDRGDIGSWRAVIDDIDTVVDTAMQRSPGLPTFVVGHSLGGAIAVAYALEHQDRLAGISLSGPALVLPPEMLAMVDMPDIPVLDVAAAVSSDPAVVEDYRNDPLVHLGAMPRNLLRLIGECEAFIERMSELTLPIQIMHGSQDMLIPAGGVQVLVRAIVPGDLSVRIWPGLFHEIFNEPNKADVLAELVRWIAYRAR